MLLLTQVRPRHQFCLQSEEQGVGVIWENSPHDGLQNPRLREGELPLGVSGAAARHPRLEWRKRAFLCSGKLNRGKFLSNHQRDSGKDPRLRRFHFTQARSRNRQGNSLLLLALKRDSYRIVELLLKNSADPNSRCS